MENNELLNWTWFELNFQWIGLIGAIVLLILLFGTDKLRNDKSVSKWKDYTWLSWAGLVAYLLHNVEEYGIDLFGNLHGFPISITHLLTSIKPDGNVPQGLLYAMVNVPAFWIVSPIASFLSRKYPLTGLTVYSIISVNIFMHIVPFIAGQGYNSGLLTTIFIFIPLCIWTFYTCFSKGRLNKRGIYIIVGSGIIMHIILMLAMFGYTFNVISYPVSVAIEALNSFLLLGIVHFLEKHQYKKMDK